MRYVVVKKYNGKIALWFILDDLTNTLVGQGFVRREDAEKVCRRINREIGYDTLRRHNEVKW